MPLRLAFTGTGYISKIHAQAAKKLPEIEMAAVVNHRPESMAAFAKEFGIPRQQASEAGLPPAGGVDALVVSPPNYLPARETIAALNAGGVLMAEKPLALNAAEAEAM